MGTNWPKSRESKTSLRPLAAWDLKQFHKGKKEEPLSIIHSFNKWSVNFFPMPGTESHCSMVTSNLAHKLEGLTQVGVTDVSTDRTDQRTVGDKEGDQVCPPSKHP